MPDSIRTLFISRDPPHPPISGTALRIWQNLNIMEKLGPVAFFTACRWEPTQKSLPKITWWQHYNVERPRSWAEQLERQFWWLRPLAYPEADWVYSKVAAQELDEFLKQVKPDLVIFEEVWLYRYLPIVKRHQCRTILVEHNIEFPLCQTKYDANPSLKEQLKMRVKLPKIKAIEQDFIAQVDQVWACSEYDVTVLEKLYGNSSKICVIPNGVNLSYYQDAYSGQNLTRKPYDLMFLGQLSYAPNTEAVNLLIDAIYPRLREINPDCRLLLVGARPTQRMLEVAQHEPGIIVTGKVPEVLPYLGSAGMMLVPLLKGGGTRLKILEAFASGCPVISTSKGAQGLKVQDGQHLLIRDDVDAIVEGVSQLWSNPALSTQLSEAAYQLVKQEYSWDAISQRVQQAVKKLF